MPTAIQIRLYLHLYFCFLHCPAKLHKAFPPREIPLHAFEANSGMPPSWSWGQLQGATCKSLFLGLQGIRTAMRGLQWGRQGGRHARRCFPSVCQLEKHSKGEGRLPSTAPAILLRDPASPTYVTGSLGHAPKGCFSPRDCPGKEPKAAGSARPFHADLLCSSRSQCSWPSQPPAPGIGSTLPSGLGGVNVPSSQSAAFSAGTRPREKGLHAFPICLENRPDVFSDGQEGWRRSAVYLGPHSMQPPHP